MTGCLDGIRVLELARYQAGPRCGMMLSDLGAEVIKIEKPGGEETRGHPPIVNGQSLYFSMYNRGKKSICLDLRQEQGRSVFFDLLGTADFVLENFRPGTLAKMGLGYDELCAVKPDIIVLSASAFGQYGPYRERPGFDSVGQAMSGLMMLTGKKFAEPVETASSVVDRYTALHLSIGALAALRHRDATRQGQVVDVCLMDSALTMVEIPISHYLSTGITGDEIVEIKRLAYKAKDGWVVISPGRKKMHDQVAQLLRDDGTPNGDGASHKPVHVSNPPTKDEIAQWCVDRTVAEICEQLNARGIVGGPVNSIADVAKDPHLFEREMLVKMDDPVGGEIYLPGLTIKFSKTPGKLGPVPTPGQHTDDILGELCAYDSERIASLREDQVVS